jgi:hypothetical protein
MSGFVTVEMTMLALTELTKYPTAAFDAVAGDGNTTLIEKGLFKKGQQMPRLRDGWSLKVFLKGGKNDKSKHGDEVEGRVILFPSDLRTQKIWLKGQHQLALNAGLNEEQAANWVRSKVPYKHDCLDILAQVMRKPKKVEAYLKWPHNDRPAQAEWLIEHQMKDPLPAPRRGTVAQLVADLVHGVPEEKPQILNTALGAALAKIEAEKAGHTAIEAQGDISDEAIDDALNGNGDTIVAEEDHPAEAVAEVELVVEEAVADQPPQQ